MSLEHISYCLNRQGCFLASLLKVAEPSGKWPLDIPKGGACSTKWSQESRTLWRRERSFVLLLSLAQRTELCSLTFSGAEKEAKRHPPTPSPSLYGRGVPGSGGKPPYVRGLVWLTKPVPLRGEPWVFYRLARGVSHGCLIGWRVG